MPADEHHLETIEAEPMIRAVVATETVLRNAVTVVTAALLPRAVLGLPTMCTISLPRDLLFARMSWAPLLCGPVVPLLTLLALLILLAPGLLLTLLALLILLPSGLLLTLLILMAPGLLLLLGLLPLLPLGVLFLSWGLSVLFVLPLPCVRGTNGPEKKKQDSRADKTHSFHDVASITAIPYSNHLSSLARVLFPSHSLFPRWFLQNWLCPEVHPGHGMKESKNVQEPQDHGNHDDCIQNGLDRSLHRYEAIDYPEQNAYYD